MPTVRRRPTIESMAAPALRLLSGIGAADRERIDACCSHARVAGDLDAYGYRRYDLGGTVPAYHLRRFGVGSYTGSLALVGAVSLQCGGEPAPDEPALVRVDVTLGTGRTPIGDLERRAMADGRFTAACTGLLAELASLELYSAADCPICAA